MIPWNKPAFLTAKIIDIGMVTMYYFIIGIAVSWATDSWLGKFDDAHFDKISTVRLFFEIVLHIFIIGVIAYLIRNLIEYIPFPLDGVGGFEHRRLKEIEGGIILPFVLIFFQKNLNDKVAYFKRRVTGLD